MSSRSQSSQPRTDGNDSDSSSTTSAGESARPASAPEKKVSCQPCREAKVKCIPSPDSSGSCSRCTKLERECFYRVHKRGRKPGKIKLQQILRRLELLDRTLREIKELNSEVRDADADSLIETLMWQLHRSKFFSKGSASGVATNNVGGDGEAKKQERQRSGSAGVMGMDRGVQKSRSDFNMLVDMEDRASVARVPDEFPTLSNPLKLLAQASSDESERRRGTKGLQQGDGQERSRLRNEAHFDDGGDSGDEEEDEMDRGGGGGGGGTSRVASTSGRHAMQGEASAKKRARSRSPTPPTASTSKHHTERALPASASQSNTTSSTNSSSSALTKPTTSTSTWASTYFSRGAFHPVYDNRPEFDPIDCHLLTIPQATRLLNSFYSSFGTFMHILDPALSTITYIRKHSAFLLTVICSLAAEFESSADEEIQAESAALAVSLRRHYEEMMTWVACGDYKNVEMAQAFFLLASYRPMSDSAPSDQTWLFLGTAIRIATELGCNLVCYSYGSTTRVGQGKAEQEHYQRQLRNTERLWINLWNLEKTLASQTGQRMHLADEGVIATSSRWHRMPCALAQDEALIAQVELRRIMIAQGDHFNTHVLRSLGARRRVQPSTSQSAPAESTAERDQLLLQLSYFRNSVTMDLKRWEERWLSSASSTPTPLQITGPLSLDYAALVTYALPLPISYSVDVTAELAELYRHCYISCTNYMATFIDRSQRALMDHVTNSTVISTVYAVVFALDLARKAQRRNAGKGVDFGFVSSARVVNLAKLTARELDKIGEARRGSEGSVASRYSGFLRGVLGRVDATEGAREEGKEEGEEEERKAARRGFASTQAADASVASHVEDETRRQTRNQMGKQGTRASHSYSSNLLFSPQPLSTTPPPSQWHQRFPLPPHHAPTPSSITAATTGQNWIPPPPAAQPQAMSPATWFGGLQDDPSWEWMMKDLDFFSVDGGGGGGEPILDQMGRLFS